MSHTIELDSGTYGPGHVFHQWNGYESGWDHTHNYDGTLGA
jgi:hypothetical protein